MPLPVKRRVILDSGAFSAMRKKSHVSLRSYAEYLRTNQQHVDFYFNLDVIPDGPSSKQAAAELSWANWFYLKRRGLDPVPVYHYGESRRWLEKYLEFGATRIGLGGLVRVGQSDRERWIGNVFKALPSGFLVHGLGMTSLDLVMRFPWASVDSTSWLVFAATSRILVDRPGRDPIDVNLRITSHKSIKTYGPAERAYLNRYVESRGYSLDRLQDSHEARAEFNAKLYAEKAAPIVVYFAHDPAAWRVRAIEQAGGRHLLSYWYLRTKKSEYLPWFVNEYHP